jgi:predicted nucleic acid-binding protein
MVEDLLVAEDTEVFVSAINLGEVLYVVQRSFGEQAATLVETKILDTPKVKVVEASWPRVKSAARIKAGGDISYADCFGAALTEEMGATLVTSDPDFRRLEADGRISIAWLS